VLVCQSNVRRHGLGDETIGDGLDDIHPRSRSGRVSSLQPNLLVHHNRISVSCDVVLPGRRGCD